ncbi:DUF6973 domain-containing protein [Elizabethkingia meningoseptica]|uniref:DUF6973 domain-containing protein n=1 Tax=Elizabethkingia meningoseptica TaxID=238 RepID=UPI0008416CBD|nr:hypothetical protein [Elizabethkingia meningoseptica]MDE5431732.1 hypothetical protein [Elizabethkingia meningoseptica]ODM53341.1 hypothetical protein BES09_10975 [Elizabethkingia meningoseptica]OHT28241.1 hypothetical protein BFF93_10985 [Elizabethkingia meningoseptica]OPC07385.1 hypothetical protein BAX93_15645 [Elizabethkingia meningoseptica]
MRTLKVFINSFRQLTFKKFIRLLKLSLSNPIFSVLSFIATVRAYTIAKKYYPRTNSTDGKGNAFRHALWCCLILMYCCKVSSPRKCLQWCKKVTDFHEEIFPNEPLQTKMDLHNNSVGIQFFESLLPGIHRQFFETSFFIKELIEKTDQAVFVTSMEEEIPAEQLMYIQK